MDTRKSQRDGNVKGGPRMRHLSPCRGTEAPLKEAVWGVPTPDHSSPSHQPGTPWDQSRAQDTGLGQWDYPMLSPETPTSCHLPSINDSFPEGPRRAEGRSFMGREGHHLWTGEDALRSEDQEEL